MYYRRKIILAILQNFGGRLPRIDLQKLLFIFTRQQTTKAYDFVPYKFGCFSFQANSDLNTMLKYGQVSENDIEGKQFWKVEDSNDYFQELNLNDKNIINYLKRTFVGFSSDNLIKYTYINYPYFAIKSTIAKSILSEDEFSKVQKQKPSKEIRILYTIGYEGISLESYFNKLIINDVKVLCDVRKNPLSMKNGFSKTQLKNVAENLGIKYIHIPELGIESEKRQNLSTQSDYNKLFLAYEHETLSQQKEAKSKIYELMKAYDRIALTCFEANHCQCHRGTLAKSLTNMPDWNFDVKHL